MITDKTYSSKSFFSIKDKGKQQAATKLGYSSTNRKIQLDGGEAVLISGVKPEQLSNAINTKRFNLRNFFPLTIFGFFQRKFILIHLILLIITIAVHDDENFTIDRVQLFGVYIAPILISYSIYILLMLRVDQNKGIFDRSANERQSLVFNKHRNKLFEADQNVIEQQINLSDMKKWKDIEVGDIIIIYKDEHCPCEVLVLDFQGEHCILDMHYINGNTVYKKIKPLKVTRSQQQAKNKGSQIDFRKMFKGLIEYSRNEYEEIKGYIKLKQDPQVEQFSDENIIPRAAIIKQEWVFGIALYTGLECKQFKHQNNQYTKEKESFFLNKIEFFCLFHYLLLLPILVQRLIFQASSTCYDDLQNFQRFYFSSFNMRQFFITITDALPLFPIVIYIIVDGITLIEIFLQNHEIITKEDNKFVRLKSLAEVKNSKRPIQSFEKGGQQNIQTVGASQSQFATVTKIPFQQPNQQAHIYSNFTVIQNSRDKSVSIVNHLSQQKKKNQCFIYLQKCFNNFIQLLSKLKHHFQRNFTQKLLYPHFRIREPLPIADLSVTSHVIIGKTNVISYPYSSEVCKMLYTDVQYKFIPDKIQQKYEDYMKKYQNLKKKLNENKQMKRLGLNFKRKRVSEREKTDVARTVDVDKLGYSVNQMGSDDRLTIFNTLAQSEFGNLFERNSRLNDSTGRMKLKRDMSEDKNIFNSENKQAYQRSYSMNNLQESPEFSSHRSNNHNYQINNIGFAPSNQKKVAESIILEESNHSIKTKLGAGGNTNKHGYIYDHIVTQSDRLQSLASNLIKDSDLHIDGFGQSDYKNILLDRETPLNLQKRASQSMNHINQLNNNINGALKSETMGSLNKIKHQNSITENNQRGEQSSRNRTSTLQREKSHNSDYEDISNISNNQINSMANYQKNSINAVRVGRDDNQAKSSGRSSRNNKNKLSIEVDDDDIPNEKESSFKKEYLNEIMTTNQQSADLIQENGLVISPQFRNKAKYKSNNLNTINSLQPETMRNLIDENLEDAEIKYPYFSKPPSQNSRILIASAEGEELEQEHSILEQEQKNSKEAIRQKFNLKGSNGFNRDTNGVIQNDKNESITQNENDCDETNEFNDIPSEKVSEKMRQRQVKSIINKHDNSSGSFSWGGEINSEMNESVRLRNNNFGNNMNSLHFSAQKKFIYPSSSQEKSTPNSLERDILHNLQSTSTKKERFFSNQSYKQRSLSQQFIPHPFTIEEQEEEQNKTPLPISQKKELLSNSSNLSEKQISQSKRQRNEQNIQKDSSRRFSLEESLMSRSSRNPSIRFGVQKQSTIMNLLASNNNNNNNTISGSIQISLGKNGGSRRNSQFKQGIIYSEESPRNKKKSLKIDMSKIEDQNYMKFLSILNKDENTGTHQQQNIPGEIDEQKHFQNNGTSIESPQLGKFMNIPWEKQDSGRKSGSVREFTDMNSIDSVRGGSKSRQYQLSMHSRDQENQKIERKPAKQFTFQTRQMVSSSIRQDRHMDMISNTNNESNLQDNSQNQIQNTIGQNESNNNNKRLDLQLQLNSSDKHISSTGFHKKSFQLELQSSENHYDPQEILNEDDPEDEEDDELDNDDDDEEDDDNQDDQKSSNLKRNKILKSNKLNSEINSKNDSVNEIKSDIHHLHNEGQNSSIIKKNQTPKRKRSSKNLNKSTLPKIQIKRQSLEMGQLSARLNLSPVKLSSNKFFGSSKNTKTKFQGQKSLLSDSNKSSRSSTVNFAKIQGFQDHSIPKDIDKFLEHYVKENSTNRKQIRSSLKCLVLCHQTVTKFDIDKNQLIHTFYNEEEEMILRFAKNLGYNFKLQNLKQNVAGSYQQEYIIELQDKIKKYQVIAFHRTKYRFSILIKRKEGADLIMREELKTVPLYLDFQRDLMAKIIHKNMQNGFRSVLISKYFLNKEETDRFVNQLGNLQTNIVKEREALERLFGVYEEKESGMQFVTLLGVREKLRENTDIFLNSLYNNKIKTWMLTGEQYTRALSSAYLSQIIKPEDSKNQNNLINIHFESNDYDDIKFIVRRNLEKVQNQLLGEDQEKNSAFHNKDQHTKFQRKKSRVIIFGTNELEQQLQFQIIIKGDVLKTILEDPVYLKSHFLFLCHFCKGFVAYEVDSDTKQMLLKALKKQESNHRFLAITNDRGLSKTANFSIEIENPQNSCPFVADACIDSFQDLYKLIFLHGRRQADFINLILNFQVYRQMLFYIVSLIIEDMYCVEGENPMNQIEITVFNYLLNFFSLIPLFIQYFNPEDPEKLKKSEEDNLKFYSMQYQTTKDYLSKTEIPTYTKLLVAALIQALLIFFGMDQILQSIQHDGKLIGFEETRMVTFIMIMVVTQFQIIYFSGILKWQNIMYQSIVFLISTVIYLSWKSNDNTMFEIIGELFEYPSFFVSFLVVSVFSCMIFEIIQQLLYVVPLYLEKNLELIESAINFFENCYTNLRASRLADLKKEGERAQNNHLTLLGVIRQYFTGQTEIDEIVLSMMNTGIDNIHTGISKITQKFDNLEFEEKYIKRSIVNQIMFSKAISLILFFTFDIFLLVLIIIDSQYSNSQKVILIVFICIVLIFTLLKWRYEQCFIVFNYGLILTRVGYLIAAIQVINDYDNFLIMLVFMYILYFVQLVRMDIVIMVYTFFALYDSINFVIGISSSKYTFSKEYLAYYIINALSLISAFTYMLLSQKYQYGMMDRQQYLSANKLQLEMQKFNEVLSILLPKFIRDQIQSDNQNVVKIENQVSIIFCDIYNFDDIIAKKNVEVIKLLDNLYRAFDILCNLNGLQKIETVGKTYMACGGIVQNKLQQREGQYSEFNEVKCAINFAFEILEYSSTLTFGDDGEKIQLKIGIHFGSVIAGVIGYHKPQFSLIGDTVNTTSRVCSTSEPGTVTLSEQAYERVKECDVKVQQMDKLDKVNEKFRINDAKQKRVEAKGKGELITYQVQKYKTKKLASPEAFLPVIRDRITKQSIQFNNLKLEESPQSEKFPNNTDQASIGDQHLDSNERNNLQLLISPQQQIRQKQAIALQHQLIGQKDLPEIDEVRENAIPSSSLITQNNNNNNNNMYSKNQGNLSAVQANMSGQIRQELLINLNQQIQGDNLSNNDGGGLTYSRHFSNLQVTPQGQRISVANQSMMINTPDAMLKSNGSKISVSNQNAAILGHNIMQNNPNNLSIPGYTQTNSILNYQNTSNLLYSPNLLAIRAEKSDTNAQELVSNLNEDQKNKANIDTTQHRSHNFSISHFQELKSENKSNNLDSQRFKLVQNNLQQNEEASSQKVAYNSGTFNINGLNQANKGYEQQSPSKNVQAVAQKLKLAENNIQKKNISKNIASILLNINNNEAEELTPSLESKKQSKIQSSAESRKNTSNNTLPKHDEILPPFSNSGSVQLNTVMLNSGRNSNSGQVPIVNVNKVDTGLRKKSIFNPNSQFINTNILEQIALSNNFNKLAKNNEKQKLQQPGFLGYDKARHTVYTNSNIGIAHNTVSTPQSKTSLHKLHQIKNLQGFSDLLNNQQPCESSGGGGGASSNKISGNSQLFKKRDEKVNSKSHSEFDIMETSSKSGNAMKLTNLNSLLHQNLQQNSNQLATPFNRTPLKRNTRTAESTQTYIPQQQNSVSLVQNFLSKGLPQQDQNSSLIHHDHHFEISPPVQQKRKSFFYNNNLTTNQIITTNANTNTNNNNNTTVQSPPLQTKSQRLINQINTPINANGRSSSNLQRNSNNSGLLYQSISSSMQHLPDPNVKIVINNIKEYDAKMGNTPINRNVNKPRRGSSAQNIGLPSHLQNDYKNKKQYSNQNSLQDNKSVHSKQSSQNKETKKTYSHFASQEEKSNENLFKYIPPTQNNQNNPTLDINTQQSNPGAAINQINIQFDTSPNNIVNRKDSTTKSKHTNDGNPHNMSGILFNQKSPDATPKNRGRLTPSGLNQRSSSNTNNHSLRSSNTPNESNSRKINQTDLIHQGYLNQFVRNQNQIDNQLNANLMKRLTLEKRLTEYTIRSKSNTKSSKYTIDNKSPALTHFATQQVNSQVQLDPDIEQIMEEEEQQIREDQESILSSEKKLIFFDYQEIDEKIIAEGKYSLENQVDPSHLRKVYDEQDIEELEEKKLKKKDQQNDQFRLSFNDVFPFKRKKSESEFDLSKDFFAQQIQKAQDTTSTRFNLWVWLFIYVLKTISYLIVRDKLINIFILMVILRTLFIIGFAFFIYKTKFIFNMWDIKRIKFLIYGLYLLQYSFFYIETSLMNLRAQNTFSSNLQSAEQFFAFVVFTEFIFQYYSEKILICLIFVFSEIILSIFKEGYFRLMTLLSITIFSSIYHLIMHYIIIQFQISNFNDIRNLEFKRLLYKRFLYNLLPSHIMGQLLSQQPDQQIELTDSLENTTLLFADIAGFTKYCSGKDPEKVLYMLQNLFVQFDKACIDNEVYKVYTIGDCYVVMGTLNAKQRKPSIEAKNVIQMAFSMIKAIEEAKKKEYSDIDMRIGIHTGDIIGGVIGTDIVRYDIYGPNVLIANKMESNGERGKVMISETTYKLVKGSFPNSFDFQEREEDVIIKSLNNLQVKAYFVSEKSGDPNDFIQPDDPGFQDQVFIPYNPEESGEYYENDELDHDEEFYTQQDQQYDEENDEADQQQYEDDGQEENNEEHVSSKNPHYPENMD